MTSNQPYAHLLDMRSELSRMEKRGRVDSTFVGKIDAVTSEFRKMEEYWVTQKKIALRVAFMFYMAVRNARLILERMKRRFKESEVTNDNPKVVEDSAMVVSLILEIYQRSARASQSEANLDPFMPNEILNLLSTLRITASATGLLPRIEDEMRGVNQDQFRQAAANLDKKFVALNFVECT